MDTIKKIFEPLETGGHSCMILTGRSIYDLECRKDGSIAYLEELMEEYALSRHMVVVRYILAKGVKVPYGLYEKNDVDTIKRVLSANDINNVSSCQTGNCNAAHELIKILDGISRLSSGDRTGLKWHDGESMKFLFLFEFTSDIMPTPSTENQKVARELLYQLVYSRSFLTNGDWLILNDVVEGKIDEQIRGLIYQMFLTYPGYEEKLDFVKGLHKNYPNARYEDGLDDKAVANLTSSIPNKNLEPLFISSHNNGTPIEAKRLIEQKTKDIQAISEGTITMLDTSRVKNVDLKGSSVRVPLDFLEKQARGLLSGEKTIHANILLIGAPGTAKTDLSLKKASESSVPIFQLNSPKGGIVGETERLSSLQVQVFSSTTPSIGFIDEITEAMPMQRTQNLDSGASDAVMHAFLNTLSDNTREGKSILIATTNCGYKIGSAMRDRFIVVPVIMPSIEDFPEIICSIAKQVSGAVLNPGDSNIVSAAKVFYDKHLMPRRIRASLKLECGINGLTSMSVLHAAMDANPLDEPSWLSAVYADLCAISLTVSKSLLPWYGQEETYPYPDYIKVVLDDSYQVDPTKLHSEIKRLEPYVNV